jgi:hypothetical protein
MANEGQSFTLSSSSTVRYGVDTRWIQKTLSGTVPCTNSFFGSDPAYGVVKECDVLVSSSTPATGTTSTDTTAGTTSTGTTSSDTTTGTTSTSTTAPLPSVTLTSATTGTAVPFSFGQVFRKGTLVPGDSVVVDTTTTQMIPISTWDDGSVKHALVAGTANLTANVPKSVSITKGASLTGTALSESDLIAAKPQASVSYGSYGTVSLSSVLGTSARVVTEHAGPHYASFQYIAAFPNDVSLRAVFYVQLWRGGNYRVRVAVENGTAPTTSSTKSGTATVTVAGTTRFSGSVSMPQGVRWDAVGSNFSVPNVGHDPVYLRATKLVPNYGYRNASSTTLASLPSGYSPMARLGWEQDMGAPGYAPSIGLLPHWDALYATTGDSRAAVSALEHSRAFGSYSVFYRDPTTRAMPTFSQYPTAVNDESFTGNGTNPNRWEVAHHPHAGYLAWLMTAERFHLEALQANAYAAWHSDYGTGKTGVDKIYSSQTRARAWRYRTIAAAAAVSPDGDKFKLDAKANIVANLNNWLNQNVVPNSPTIGLAATYDDQDSSVAGLQRSLFEHLFLAASIGWSWDQEMKLSSTERAVLAQVRDYFYRIPIGLTGRGPASGEYSWRTGPGPYRATVGPTSTSFYGAWGDVYKATYNDNLDSTAGLPIIGSYADDATTYAFPQGNWGHLMTALSYAVDHGASGASAGYGRVTGASNWSSNAAKFNDWPQYGVVPRP